jgi:hypothetical protein
MRDTIDMAFEAGFDSSGTELTWESVICTEELKTFEALVRADEREACAKVCDAVAQQMDYEGEGPTGNIGWVIGCAASIRTRNEQ